MRGWVTRYRALALLALLMLSMLALGWTIARDVQHAGADVTRLYDRLSEGVDLLSDLQFETQEVRRILLYALYTTDANLQLAYAEQSRQGDSAVQRLLARGAALRTARTRESINAVREAWREYVLVRDEVIGLILERSVAEAVRLDENRGTASFARVRAALDALSATFKADAQLEVLDARLLGVRATRRLTALVVAAVAAGMIGLYLVRRRVELERREEQLRRARDAAEIATRAKSDFLATMSHELRTPLSGVIGAAELLSEDEVPPQKRELLRTLRGSAHQLMDVLNEVLDYSRIESGLLQLQPTPFAIRDCLEDALLPVKYAAERKGLAVRIRVDEDVPALLVADRTRVRQVLLNLLSNAVKYTDTGEVSVHVTSTLTPDGGRLVTAAVRDTGRGIAAARQHQLFQRFSRIGERAGSVSGSGLGLAISERLSRLLGGALTVESEEGLGSSFTFTFRAALPTPADAPGVPPGRAAPVTSHAAPPLAILLVEDNDANRRVIRMMLSELGHEADEAISGDEAVAAAARRPYDVIFMDVHLPGIDGLEATRRIRRAQQANTPWIIALTASAVIGEPERCREAGMDAYLAKPLRLAALDASLRHAASAPDRSVRFH